MHREAKKAFDALGVKKLHSIKSLSKEYEQELAGKRKLYTEYCILRSPAAAVAVCERPACGINGRMFIQKFSSGG